MSTVLFYFRFISRNPLWFVLQSLGLLWFILAYRWLLQ